MNTADNMPRRLTAGAISHGVTRRIGPVRTTAEPTADELDHRLGFDLGYRDGLATATAEAETAAIEARMAWEAAAQGQLDAALVELDTVRSACREAARALGEAHDGDRTWATMLATEVAYAAVVRLLGERAADRPLLGEYCAHLVATTGHDAAALYVAPAVLDEVRAHVTSVPVRPDAALECSGCRLEGERGQLRAGLRERLDGLRDALLGTLDNGPTV